jgi:hypothetical protein
LFHFSLAARSNRTLYDRNRRNVEYFQNREGCYPKLLPRHLPKMSDEPEEGCPENSPYPEEDSTLVDDCQGDRNSL